MRNFLAAVLVALLLGCQQTTTRMTPPPPAPAPASVDLRKALESDPTVAAVGVVEAVDPTSRMLQVTGVAAEKFREGDVVSVMDASGVVLTAHVLSIKSSALHVDYAMSKAQRAPAKGDLVVKFKS